MPNFQETALRIVRRKIREVRANDIVKLKANDCLICVHLTTKITATILIKSECSIQTWASAKELPHMSLRLNAGEYKTCKEAIHHLIHNANEKLPPLIAKWKIDLESLGHVTPESPRRKTNRPSRFDQVFRNF